MFKDTFFIKILSYFYEIMTSKISHGIGVMSGTSLDGVDICYIRFDHSNTYRFKILDAETIPYTDNWKNKLKNAYHSDKDSLSKLDVEYGGFLGDLIQKFISDHAIRTLDFVASHGHTIFHKPEEGYTLQIGNGQAIADIVNHIVVNDFRTQDVKLGGQGAPLVPIGDELLFSEYDYCLNLGGFANISFKEKNARKAFDICPVNIVLNHYINRLDLPYDDKGILASEGKIHKKLLNKLNELDFYQLGYPKSLGLEWVIKFIFPLIDSYNLEVKDILRTFIEHVSLQISKVMKDNTTVLATGGGVFNSFLIKCIEEHLDHKLIIPESDLIDYKEALIFALLGLLKLEGKVNVLSSVTGAKHDHSSGVIFKPNKR